MALPDASREVRAALVREQRERECEGLRSRVRALGGGQYALAQRRLDPELVAAERDLIDRAGRMREQTRTQLRRRIQRLSAQAFEVLARALCEKLGIGELELIRRGEGVAYLGGRRIVGIGQVRVLIALRPGDVEISRRAVGELRAGLQVKGFEEGLMFAGGRAGGEGMAELKAGANVRVYDGAQLAMLLCKHGLGVRRLLMPIDYFDSDLFSELTES
jgi:hypothetical protein